MSVLLRCFETLSGLAIIVTMAASTANAANVGEESTEPQSQNESLTNWESMSGTLTMSKPSTSRQRGGMQVAAAEYMGADKLDGPGGVSFLCSNGGLVAAVSLEGRGRAYNQIARTITAEPNKQRRIRPQIVVDGDKQSRTDWLMRTDNKMIVPIDPKVSIRIYNAAITRKPIMLKGVRGTDDFMLHLPEPNQDFAYFGGDCGMGRNAGK